VQDDKTVDPDDSPPAEEPGPPAEDPDAEQLSTDRIDDTSGEQIPILGWYGIPSGSGTRALYQEMRLAGFTHNFPTETGNSFIEGSVLNELNLAQSVGMKTLIYADMMDHPTAFVNQLKAHPANGGYIVRDEPSARDFPALAATVRKIQALDSEHPCYINLFSYGASGETLGISDGSQFLESYLRAFIRDVPVPMISFDDYPIRYEDGKRTIRSGGRTPEGGPGGYGWYGALELFAAETRAADKPLWAFALATAHGPFPVPTIDDLRLQVYSNLAYGVQCIQYFTYWTPAGYITGPLDRDGQKTETYSVVQAMNKEIIALSPVFLNAKVAWTAHTGEIPDVLCSELKKEQLPEVIQSLNITGGKGALVSLLEKGKDRFLVIVNHDINSDIQVQVIGLTALRRVRKDGSIVIPNHKTWTVTPGDALIYFWKSK
jgi:hypothetical protein